MSDDVDDLVDAMHRTARMVDVVQKCGLRRGAELRVLVAEFGEIHRLGTELCAGGWVADERIVDLTRRVERVSAKLLEEIKPCGPKRF